MSFHRKAMLGNLAFWGFFLYTSRHNFGISLMRGWRQIVLLSMGGLAVAWELLHEVSVESQGTIREIKAIEKQDKHLGRN
jgi:hypothetical protein